MKRFFDIAELESSTSLYWAMWALLLGWLLEFYSWSSYADFTRNAVAQGRQLCWPFFQSCGNFYFLSVPPLPNTQGLAYATLFGLMVWAGVSLARRKLDTATYIFVALFLWEALVMLMSMRLSVNYWYFHFLYAALFLFARPRLTYMRLGAVLLYFLSGLLKLNDGWLMGAYFKSLVGGVYFVPDSLIPLATNLVIFMELVIVWFLFSKSRTVRLSALAILALFHAYSSIYVGLIYPTVVLPMVMALFLLPEVSVRPNLRKPLELIGACMLLLLCVVDAVPYFIAGPSSLTGEGNKMGVYMFNANYQCTAIATTHYKNGKTSTATSTSSYAIERCDPYADFFYLKELCAQDPSISSIALTFDSSINGSPFYRIVDVPNACALEYQPFKHNTWIKIPGVDQVPIVGYPQKNLYRPL